METESDKIQQIVILLEVKLFITPKYRFIKRWKLEHSIYLHNLRFCKMKAIELKFKMYSDIAELILLFLQAKT